MPTFRIQGPDGKVYRVQADDQGKAVSGLKATLDAQQRRPANKFEDQATRNMSLGLSDPVNAGISALISQAPRIIGKDPGYSLGDAYRAAKAVETQRGAEYEKANPKRSLLAGVVGGLGMPGGKQLASAATPIAKGLLGGLESVARGGAIGAGLGGAYGALTATPDEGTQGAMRGAVAGGLTGAAVPAAAGTLGTMAKAAGNVGKTIARSANKASGGQLLSPTREAGKRLVDALRKDGMTPGQIRAVQNEWMKNGVTPNLIDVVGADSHTGALLRGAALSGSGRKAAGKYSRQIIGNLQDEALDLTRGLTPGETRSAGQLRQALEAERSATADTMYPAFKGDQLPAADVGTALQGSTGRVALARARTLADAMRDDNALAEINALEAGTAQNVSAGTLDLIRRGLRDSSMNAAAKQQNTLSGGLTDRSMDIERALVGDPEAGLVGSPGFDAARNAFRNTSQAIDAIDFGATGPKAAPEAFASQFGALPEQAVLPGQVGYREALEKMIGSPAEGSTGILNQLATSKNQKRNLGVAFPEEAESYRAGLGNLIDQVQNSRFLNPNTNSQSVGRALDEQLVELPNFKPQNVFLALINKLRNGATLTDAERQAIVELGTSNQLPPEVGELLLRQPRNMQLGSRLSPASAITAAQIQAGQ